MSSFTNKLVTGRRGGALALTALTAALGATALPVTASANSSQIAIIQDGGATGSPQTTIPQMRALGATTIRIFLPWTAIAPSIASTKKPSFNDSDPSAYPEANWSSYDAAIRQAAADHMTVDLTVTGGAPLWAEGSGLPSDHRTAYAVRLEAQRQGLRRLLHRCGQALQRLVHALKAEQSCLGCISGRSTTSPTSARTSDRR